MLCLKVFLEAFVGQTFTTKLRYLRELDDVISWIVKFADIAAEFTEEAAKLSDRPLIDLAAVLKHDQAVE